MKFRVLTLAVGLLALVNFAANGRADNHVGLDAGKVISACLKAEGKAGRDGSACISRFANACIEKGEGNAGASMACINAEFRFWDKVLNTQYRTLMRRLDSDKNRKELRAAQRLWVSFKTTMCPLAFNFTGGSLYRLTGANCILRLTANQAFELFWLAQTQAEPRQCVITQCGGD